MGGIKAMTYALSVTEKCKKILEMANDAALSTPFLELSMSSGG